MGGIASHQRERVGDHGTVHQHVALVDQLCWIVELGKRRRRRTASAANGACLCGDKGGTPLARTGWGPSGQGVHAADCEGEHRPGPAGTAAKAAARGAIGFGHT